MPYTQTAEGLRSIGGLAGLRIAAKRVLATHTTEALDREALILIQEIAAWDSSAIDGNECEALRQFILGISECGDCAEICRCG